MYLPPSMLLRSDQIWMTMQKNLIQIEIIKVWILQPESNFYIDEEKVLNMLILYYMFVFITLWGVLICLHLYVYAFGLFNKCCVLTTLREVILMPPDSYAWRRMAAFLNRKLHEFASSCLTYLL